MFTTCTHCHARFRLNVAQLTAAQGSVRCGKCGEIFDAYEVLEGADLPPQMAPRIPAPDMAPEAAEDFDVPAPMEEEAALSAQPEAEPEVPELPSIMVGDDEPITSAPKLKAGSRRSRLPIDDLFEGIDEEPPAAGEPDANQA